MNLKKNNWIIAMSCMWFVLASCSEDESASFSRYYIMGLQTVDPETVEVYSLGNHTGDFVWSTSNADIAEVISSSDSDVEVRFNKSGEVRLLVSSTEKDGHLDITVSEGAAESINTAYAGTGVVRLSVTDTVFIAFDAPLAETPILTLNGTNTNDTSAFFTDDDGEFIEPFNSPGETLSALQQYKDDLTTYFALYSGGSGNGQPEARLESVVISDVYGGSTAEHLYIKLPIVDNTAPVGKVELSEEVAKDGSEVTINVNFSEAMRPTMSTATDTLVFVSISGGGVTTLTDTLWSTNDPLVWTLNYTVDGGGDGTMTVSVENIVDLAGNTPATILEGNLSIDNTAPTASGSAEVIPNSQAISIETEGYWLVVDADAEAPTKAEDFSAGGIGTDVLVVAKGYYNVYFLAMDEAGNESEIIVITGLQIAE